MPVESSQESLTHDLHSLGVRQGDIIMLHASYRAVGPVAGGPEALLAALLEAVGPEGGLVMFVSWAASPYEAFARGGLTDSERADWPAYDPQTAAVHPGYAGALGSTLVKHQGALRSANPDRSLAAVGSAAPLIAGQALDHGFGPGSPLQRLYEKGAKTLLLGAPLYTVTVLHYAEYLAAIPGKHFVRYEVPLLRAGKKVWQPVTQMNRDAFIPAVAGLEPDYLEQAIRAYLAVGHHCEGQVGKACCYLFEMADLVPFAIRFFEEAYG
ncbi:MAG: aminoglycoside 3-N-acetyltransferase [Pseudomonadota bacterium]